MNPANPLPVHSCASGLDYPGVGPEHCNLKDRGKVRYVTCLDAECRDAFFRLSRSEGILPAIESAHAVAHALKKAREMGHGSILVKLSGRGDKDLDYVIENWGLGEEAAPARYQYRTPTQADPGHVLPA